MPIKLGNDTFWVDVQEDNKTGDLNSDGTVMQEDSIMLNLDMEGNGALNISKTGAQGKAYIINIYKRQKKVYSLPVKTLSRYEPLCLHL